MRTKVLYSFFVIMTAGLLFSCNVTTQEADSRQEAGPETAVQASEMNIPCFGCHSYENFRNQDAFPHDMHRGMGLHCNQCHLIKSHEKMELNSGTCNNCHDLSVLNLSLTSMPVVFNHEMHYNMFGCNDCHKDTFNMKINSVRISMENIYNGKFCGKCHNGKTAFSSSRCDGCHRGT